MLETAEEILAEVVVGDEIGRYLGGPILLGIWLEA